MIEKTDWDAAYAELLKTAPGKPGPGDPAPLTQEEEDEDWAKIQARLKQPAPPPVVMPPPQTSVTRSLQPPRPPHRLWKVSAAAAALLALVFGGLYFQMRTEVQRLSRQLGSPRVLEHHILLPDGVRGGKQPAILLPSKPDSFLLAPSLIDQPEYPEYRLDILQGTGDGKKPVWSASGLQRQSDDTVEIWVPRAFLKSGPYQLQLYGLGAGGEKLLATYTVQLPD